MSVAASMALFSSCVFDGSEAPEEEDASDPTPVASVVIPTERLSPFCQAMIDLTDRVRSGDVVDDAEIVETYRSISADVPAEIADDFSMVLQALETGAPAPTDPPRATIETLLVPETSGPNTSVPAGVAVDERFVRDGSPADRINSYVAFTCRDSDNNPGPPPTQPLDPVS